MPDYEHADHEQQREPALAQPVADVVHALLADLRARLDAITMKATASSSASTAKTTPIAICGSP